MIDYKQKYLKYKMKYLTAKRNLQSGGSIITIQKNINEILELTLLSNVNSNISKKMKLTARVNNTGIKLTKKFLKELYKHVNYNVEKNEIIKELNDYLVEFDTDLINLSEPKIIERLIEMKKDQIIKASEAGLVLEPNPEI